MKSSTKSYLKDEYLKLIGLVVVEMASLELSLMSMLGAMLQGNHQLGVNLMAGYTLERNLHLIRSVFNSFKQEESITALFNKTFNDIESINKRRNNHIVHPSWTFSPTGDRPALTVKTKPPKSPNSTNAVFTHVDPETIRVLLKDLRVSIANIQKLTKHYTDKHTQEMDDFFEQIRPNT